MSRGVLVVLLVGLVLSASSVAAICPASAHAEQRIRVSGGDVVALGAYEVARHPQLGAALQAFGEPSSTRPVGSSQAACRVRWKDMGLLIVFSNFGGRPACAEDGGLAQAATIRGANGRSWKTWRGLRLRHSRDALRRLHPEAPRHTGGWWLATTILPYGVDCPCPYPSVTARVRGGRVFSFRLWLGHAGD